MTRVLLLFALCCGPASTVGASATPTASLPTVKVGVYENKPLVFRNTDDRFTGIAVDVLEYAARQEGWRIDYAPGAWADLLAKLENGELDLLVGIAYSEQRGRRFDFTTEDLVANWGVVYKKSKAPIASPLDLTDHKVALMRDSIHTRAFIKLLEQFDVSYVTVEARDYSEVFQLIHDGAADAGVVNRLYGRRNAVDYNVVATGIIFNPIHVHYAAPKGPDRGVIEALDRHLMALKQDKASVYYQALDHWLRVPPATIFPAWLQWTILALAGILMLSLLMSALLRRQVTLKTFELLSKSKELEKEVEERRSAQQRLNHLAYHDSLTGLPNRMSFHERFQVVMRDADQNGTKIAILFIDLDRLKTINDSLGHVAGDTLLTMVAKRLQSCLRGQDSINRFGGDEYIVMVSHINSVSDVDIVTKRLMDAFLKPFDVGAQEVYITASIGVALYPDDDRTIDGLLMDADAAMYSAKDQGRNRVQLYNREFTNRAVEQFGTESRLRRALAREELRLYYQPVIDIQNHRVVGLEALLRWDDPDRGMIAPDKFIALAEDTGLIMPIGEWVLERACTQLQNWHARFAGDLRVSVNISSRQFEHQHIVKSVETALKKSGLDPGMLELEITERIFLEPTEAVLSVLGALKAQGVHLSIDDFGTGYSSLGYLKQMPVDCLKIDRSFVRGIPADSDDTEITATIIAMAQNLHMAVVAEGIETREQLEYLRTKGCQFGQGFYIARPLPTEQVEEWLRSHIQSVPHPQQPTTVADKR